MGWLLWVPQALSGSMCLKECVQITLTMYGYLKKEGSYNRCQKECSKLFDKQSQEKLNEDKSKALNGQL